MSAKTNKTLIGAFVLGALVLAVAAVLVFGSGMFFVQKHKLIMYFESSVSGLGLGSPVLFRGVPIGSVKEIRVDADESNLQFFIPVVVELESGKISLKSAKFDAKEKTLLQVRNERPEELLKTLIGKGLRAQLVTQSFVTGQLAVSLDFLPDTEIRLLGDGAIPEIPTVPSAFEEFSNTLKQLPLQKLVDKLIGAVSGIERFMNSKHTEQMPAAIDELLKESTDLIRDVKSKLGPLSSSLDKAVQTYTDLGIKLDHRVDGVAGSTEKTLETLNSTLKDGKLAINNFEKLVDSDSPTVVNLNKALIEIASFARSMRTLTDFLERHPEALIQGKGNPGR